MTQLLLAAYLLAALECDYKFILDYCAFCTVMLEVERPRNQK